MNKHMNTKEERGVCGRNWESMIDIYKGFPCCTSGKDLPANAGDVRHVGSIPGSGRSPGGGHGNLLENPMNRGLSWTGRLQSIGLKKLDKTEVT